MFFRFVKFVQNKGREEKKGKMKEDFIKIEESLVANTKGTEGEEEGEGEGKNSRMNLT